MTSFGKSVTARPLPQIAIGTGKLASLLVDAAGTAHAVFSTDGGGVAADTISYCGLQRGRKACASVVNGLAPNAPAGGQSGPFEGNFPGGNADSTGPVPLAIGNHLYLVDRRFPDAFTAPDGSNQESNVFLWSQSDDGKTFTGPAIIGTNQMGGGAIAYGGSANPSIGMISRTETGGTYFQGVGAGQYTTEQAQLGTGDQAYDGALATDGDRPAAVFDDLSNHVYVREWSGQGDVNDPANWSTASFPGSSPRIAGGPAGVFVLYRDSTSGGNVLVRKIVGGQPSGAPVRLATNSNDPVISESPSGDLAVAYLDTAGIELRTSTDGATWNPAQVIAAATQSASFSDLAVAATGDGGGFGSYVRNGTGAEDVGPVLLSAFGSQLATNLPGLGQIPGGGIGSPVGDQLATSTCTTAKFGVVTAQIDAGCFLKDPANPSLEVSLGEVNINGLRIIPDANVKIAINPKQHAIDTTGNVRVVLTGQGLNVTLWYGQLHVKLDAPGAAQAGGTLFDFKAAKQSIAPFVAGFPIDGDIDAKLVDGGVQIPLSLRLPGYFGGVTGAATLRATLSGGLQLDSVAFSVKDAPIGLLELKDVNITYTRQGDNWEGGGTINVPTGGSIFSMSVDIKFAAGKFVSGSIDVGLPYPGIILDANDTPPVLYLSHVGLMLGLQPPAIGGSAGIGFTPTVLPPNPGGPRDYLFSLDGTLQIAFGDPVTLTATATGYMEALQIANAKLVYALPDSLKLDAQSNYDLGLLSETGDLHVNIDPKSHTYGGYIGSKLIIHGGVLGIPGSPEIPIPGETIAVNQDGFAAYVPPGVTPFFFGTITYRWGDKYPTPWPGQNVTGQFINAPTASADHPSADGARARGAAVSAISVPTHTPSAEIDVSGDTGPPSVVLTAPNGTHVTPSTTFTKGASAVALSDASLNVTHLGLINPAAGRWTVQAAPGSPAAVTGVRYAISVATPKVTGKLTGSGSRRSLRYQTTLPAGVTVTFIEQATSLRHVIGQARKPSGTISFSPAIGAAGRRQILALIENEGLPQAQSVLASFIAPRLGAPKRPRSVRVTSRHGRFTISFSPPAGAARTLVTIIGTDGRHLIQSLPASARRLSVPVIGYRDGITVSVAGIGPTGQRGAGARAGLHLNH